MCTQVCRALYTHTHAHTTTQALYSGGVSIGNYETFTLHSVQNDFAVKNPRAFPSGGYPRHEKQSLPCILHLCMTGVLRTRGLREQCDSVRSVLSRIVNAFMYTRNRVCG